MDRKLLSGAFILLLSSFVLAGCPRPAPTQPPTPVEEEPSRAESASSIEQQPETRIRTDSMGNPLDPSTGAPLSRVFYFDYDEAIISRDDLDVLALHAVFLQENRNVRAVLEGHCDERGTRDYNLALGERRAMAVSSFLVSSGTGASQIESVSYGEERPANPNSSEAAWAQNRRVEIVY
ncbi:MAG: peptidoglycan-associated lipoprotein Pal [Gammaproteobacteria bacterium]|nr:peptidoglycan-associated lipoprotein Pal [Gammaproteobacteria bacterium]MCY4200449.1 peptidoglycan-associated lipoprotein Pal [Gammaproteobacteria bacterium]MCY4278624.1 peptidoglycan-associated lipoprotein Pal [Gammaproteobacteria bacterium]MCY4322391.1 peptidoglycan-associated lipoprotein Pal [Gammaproteobacteria bacterium]